VTPVEKLVLLVEDDPGDVALVQRVFERFAVVNRLEVARDGAAALERLGCGRPDAGPLDNSFVRKPIEFAKFAEAIKQVGFYWLIFDAGPPPV
jgi:hypothetical protein